MNDAVETVLAILIIAAIVGGALLFAGEKGKSRTCADCGYRPVRDGEQVCERCLADDWT